MDSNKTNLVLAFSSPLIWKWICTREFFKKLKVHSPYQLVQFWYFLKIWKTHSCKLFQIELEVVWLPILIIETKIGYLVPPNVFCVERQRKWYSILGASLAELVRSLTSKRDPLGSTPGHHRGSDLCATFYSPHPPRSGTLSFWSCLQIRWLK